VLLVVPDTTVWIAVLRGSVDIQALRRVLRTRTTYLSSVVAHELYAGTQTPEDKRGMDTIVQAFKRDGRLVWPSFDQWCQAGTILSRYAIRHGRLDRHARILHARDLLILLSAAGIGARILTHNIGDFQRWNDVLPRRQRVGIESAAGITP
jgi:predicted nucleic acid-binding protein